MKEEKDIQNEAVSDAKDKYQEELSKIKDAYIRLSADFENYKKRVAKDEVRFAFLVQAEFLLKLLPIIDNFEREFKKGIEKHNPEIHEAISQDESADKVPR